MKRITYRNAVSPLSDKEAIALEAAIAEFERDPFPLDFEESVLVDLMRQAVRGEGAVTLDDEQHEALKSLCHEATSRTSSPAPAFSDAFQQAAARLLDQVRAAATITCEGCGADNFAGTFRSRYSESEWFLLRKSRRIDGELCELQRSVAILLPDLLNEVNQDDGIRDDDAGNHRVVTDVDAEVACLSCAAPLPLQPDLFCTMDDVTGASAPQSAVQGWLGRLERSDRETHDPLSAGGLVCPVCESGQLELFVERVLVENSAGKQSGTIEFRAASTLEPPHEWSSRLMADSWSVNVSDEEDYPAALGYRVGIGCTSFACWVATGVQELADFPAALLAACALTTVAPHFGWDPDDLLPANLALRIEGDPQKREALLRKARSWIHKLHDHHFDAEMMKEAEEALPF